MDCVLVGSASWNRQLMQLTFPHHAGRWPASQDARAHSPTPPSSPSYRRKLHRPRSRSRDAFGGSPGQVLPSSRRRAFDTPYITQRIKSQMRLHRSRSRSPRTVAPPSRHRAAPLARLTLRARLVVGSIRPSSWGPRRAGPRLSLPLCRAIRYDPSLDDELGVTRCIRCIRPRADPLAPS